MIKNSLKSQYLLLSASFFRSSENSKESSDNSNKLGGLFVEDKWERVWLIFRQDDLGNNHPAYERSIEMGVIGLFVGGLLVGSIESAIQYKKYVERNDATLYFDRKEAHRYLSRSAFQALTKGVIKGAPFFGIFLGGYTLLSSCFQAYRNKQGIIEYSLGGFGIGSFLRFNYGWRGMLAGGLVGGTLGTIYGIFSWAKLKLLNIDPETSDYAPMSLSAYRKKFYEKRLAAMNEKNSDSLENTQ